MRFARSRLSDSTDADENLAVQEVTYGAQISPSEFIAENEDVAASDASALGSLDALGAWLYDNGALGAWLYNNWLHDNQDNSVEASEASTLPDSLPDLVSVDDEASMNETSDASEVSVNEASGSLPYALSSDEEVSVNETSVVSEASVNEVSVISEVSVNEASGSLTTVVSGDAEAANGQPPLFFIVYVANSKRSCYFRTSSAYESCTYWRKAEVRHSVRQGEMCCICSYKPLSLQEYS